MPSIFAYQSAEVDWCEGNFEHSEYIAEYYNTLSNVAFFILAPLLLWLNSSYMGFRPNPVRALFVVQLCIGAFSMYFHMTLSYAGQLLDELSILWGLSMCYAFWFPVRYFPGFIKNRDQFIRLVVIVTTVSTLMSFVKPALNAYALNCVAFHLLYLVIQELRKCKNPRVHRVSALMVIWWIVSISCWLVDKFLCSFCQKINFCYLHSFWHIFINVTLFYCATLVIYFDVLYELPSSEPALVYWPSETSFLALPHQDTVLGDAHASHKGCPDGKVARGLPQEIMQQSKIFYPQYESYTPRPIDRPDAQPNRPFPAFILPENLTSVGVPNLYHPPNQEKELFATPPAGFHMAPCGCFFDPRIYRIEWATANFVQPPVYKLSSGPVPQNAYLLDSPKYVPYHPAYQPVAATNSPYVLPFFKPEGPPTTAPNVTDPMGGLIGTPPAHLATFVDPPHLHQAEALGQSEGHKLTVTPPGPKVIQAAGAYDPLEPCPDSAFQVFPGFLAEEDRELKDGLTTQDFAQRNPPTANSHVLGPAGGEAVTEVEPCPDLESTVTEAKTPMEEPNASFDLPDKILLEVAMKLFDCSPANLDAETSLDGFNNGGHSQPLEDSCLSGEDSSSDIHSLNLPDELLSFDYSVPEILSAVTSLDYLYDVNAFGAESPWESRPSSAQPLLKHPESHPEPEEKTRSKVPTGKPKQALRQSCDGECPEPEFARLAV